MNQENSHSMRIVKREEKETRLIQFVLEEIASGRVSVDGQWSVVALSIQSPVVAALSRVLNDLGGAGALHVRVLLTGQMAGRLPHALDDQFQRAADFSVRMTQTSRMLDAHEQLVIGPASSWVGDCMRRDPKERDAFETFGADNAQLASWGLRSFERMWACGKPSGRTSRRSNLVGPDAGLDNVLAGENGKTTVLVAATSRH